MTTSNIYRRVRGLVAKTINNGYTADEAAAALQDASDTITMHSLAPNRIDWPKAPAGYKVEGTLGKDAKVIKAEEPTVEEPNTTDAAKKARKPSSRKAPPRTHVAGEPTQGQRVAEMVGRPQGASLEEIVEALDVLPHSARALITTQLRKKMGWKVDCRGGRYHRES